MKLLFTVLILLAGTTSDGARLLADAEGASRPDGEVDEERIAREYRNAYEAAKHGDRSGFVKLYEIAASAASAEISESARDSLAGLLYVNPQLWIQALSRVERKRLERYLERGGLTPLVLPEGVATPAQFESEVSKRLRLLRIKGRQAELAAFIIRYYKEHPAGEG